MWEFPQKRLVKRGIMYQKYIKRGLDFILSLVASIILSPVMLIVAVLVRIKLGSPVLFKQPRPGKNEKIFNIFSNNHFCSVDWLDYLFEISQF